MHVQVGTKSVHHNRSPKWFVTDDDDDDDKCLVFSFAASLSSLLHPLYFRFIFTMLSRTLFRSAAPLRRQALAPTAIRTVTTDAAAAHAENVPEVRDVGRLYDRKTEADYIHIL